MEYREDLPNGCPPAEAKPLTMRLYRLIRSFPPEESDFDSQWLEHSEKQAEWENIECRAKGLSLFISLRVARQKAKGRRMLRKEVCAVKVTPESGLVEQTSGFHFTWWPLKDCNILALCSEVGP